VTKDNIDSDNLRIGRQIRDLRKAKGVTLSEMSQRIDRSLGYLSQVERGVSALPIPVLKAISQVLEVNISWFFHSDAQTPIEELNYIVRKDNRRSLKFTGTGISEELLTPHLSSQLQMILTTLEPGAQSIEPRIRSGEEAGFIQSGTLDLTIDDQQFSLQAGDSFSLEAKGSHLLLNPSQTEETVIIWTLVGASY
jgi:transcriptional regulator with XRE-family HTH domain